MDDTYFTKVDAMSLAEIDILKLVPNTYLITRVIVPEKHRGKGFGTNLLWRVTKDADDEKATLILEVSPYNSKDYKRLKAWYESFGFICIGKNVMRREPR